MGQYLHIVGTALVVLPWLLINTSQIYTANTVANEGKETNELNSAKHKQCPFWKSGCRRKKKALSVCMHVCLCFVCFSLRVCVCVSACMNASNCVHAPTVVCRNGDGSCWIFMASVLGWGREIRRLCSGSQRGREESVYVCVCVCVREWMGVGGNGRRGDVSPSVV